MELYLPERKGQMKPIGLTMKKGGNKYQIKYRGELMLIHECVECGGLSINRIAADDDPDPIMDIFRTSLALSYQPRIKCKEQGIMMLTDMEIVSDQLYGQNVKVPAVSWT